VAISITAFATPSAIPKRRKGKTRGVASNRWQFYEAQLGPIARAAPWLRLNVVGQSRHAQCSSLLNIVLHQTPGITKVLTAVDRWVSNFDQFFVGLSITL
jgi:hypothetical protein